MATAVRKPKALLLLRHGEKDEGKERKRDTGLAARGTRRAEWLPSGFFEGRLAKLGIDVQKDQFVVFGAANNKSSRRCTLTMNPTVNWLKQQTGDDKKVIVEDRIHHEDAKTLANFINSPTCAGRVVVVFWQHNSAAKVLKELGFANPKSIDKGKDLFMKDKKTKDYKWRKNQYDNYVEITYKDGKVAAATVQKQGFPNTG